MSKPLNILLIDDDEINNFLHTRLIERCLTGIHVNIVSLLQATDAIDYLRQIEETNENGLPDYIFLDIQMPVMNGWQFLDEFNKLKLDPLRKSKIYILSSTVVRQDFAKARSYSIVTKLISKPLSKQLFESIFENE